MAKNLLIVESPNKIEKIQSFLGKDWKVMATIGHIRELKKWGTELRLGVDLETMEPIYENIKNKFRDQNVIINEINKEAKKAENIYIATDTDREGEAIGWHVAEVIENKKAKIKRIIFNEITEDAITEAIKKPGSIDMKLVNSQQTRAILDKMIGFRLTSLGRSKVGAQSVGRVKSVVLKIIIDREEEIKKFKPDYWYTINGEVKKDVEIINVDKKYSELKYDKEADANKTLKDIKGEMKFVESKKTNRTIPAPKPLEMATYLMAMHSKYGVANNAATMSAQKLYEKGLISYPRTDSTRISSKEFLKDVEKFINDNYKGLYKGLPTMKKGDQDAHEAIRPTNLSLLPENSKLRGNEKKAYELIWRRTVQSFMEPGKNIAVREIYEDNGHLFAIKKSFVVEPGFRAIEGIKPQEYKEAESSTIKVNKDKIKIKENQTSPPPRYNGASIIKKMKEEGIGRPSTYSGTTNGLIMYNYIVKEGSAFVPTEHGYEITDLILNKAKFDDIINIKYTADMETDLDKVSTGKVDHVKLLKDFWKLFGKRVEEALEKVEAKPVKKTGKKCSTCKKGDLIFKRGRFGEFIACDNYPECKHTEPLVKKPKPIEIKEDDHGTCPKCGNTMIARDSRYGTKFIGCSTFPKCDYIMEKAKTQEILLDLDLIELKEDPKTGKTKAINKKK